MADLSKRMKIDDVRRLPTGSVVGWHFKTADRRRLYFEGAIVRKKDYSPAELEIYDRKERAYKRLPIRGFPGSWYELIERK